MSVKVWVQTTFVFPFPNVALIVNEYEPELLAEGTPEIVAVPSPFL